MRQVFLVPLLVPVWALAPWFGSPASLWVMPLVALLAAALAPTPARAVVAVLASLAILCAPFWPAGVALFAMHAPIVALLAWGGGWARGRWGRRGAAPAWPASSSGEKALAEPDP